MKTRYLNDDTPSLTKLGQFYGGIYTDEFPDSDERELLENMENYLRLRERGWYDLNNYHILLLEDDGGRVAGGIVADYFARSNVGVVEFVVVDPSHRGMGLGKLLLSEVGRRFEEDSRRAGHDGLNGICAEVNDPYRRCDVREHLDGFARLRMWDKFGYRLLDFPYVQPPLSADQEAVVGLGLMFRPMCGELRGSVPAALVETIVADYQIWAMRIPDPENEPDFRQMRSWLRQRSSVGLLNMSAYVCGEEVPPFEAVEIREGDGVLAGQLAEVYTQAFSDDATAVDASEFSRGSYSSPEPVAHDYWLWGLRRPGERLAGMASFFSFPHCGFGGYATLSGSILHKGHIRRLLRLIEQQIVRVNPVATGWYGECEPDSTASRLAARLGFFKVPMTYLQPRLHTDKTGVSEGKPLDLFYKPFGRNYMLPTLPLENLRRDLREILAGIYYLDEAGLDGAMAKMAWPSGTPDNIFADLC